MSLRLVRIASFHRLRVIAGVLTFCLVRHGAFAQTARAQTSVSQPSATLPAPTPPSSLTPPPGNVLFLTARAVGTQNYVCVATPTAPPAATHWVFSGPQASLIAHTSGADRSLTHFASPVPDLPVAPHPACVVSQALNQLDCATWQDAADASAVWGERAASLPAGTDDACPNTGAIPCLLVAAVQTRPGKFNSGLLSRTTYIQRLKTVGGTAPVGSCTAGDVALVPYSAVYTFFAPGSADRKP